MGLISKCKMCNYVFKKSDGNLCPECLTGRDTRLDSDCMDKDIYQHENSFTNSTSSYSKGSYETKRSFEYDNYLAEKDNPKYAFEENNFDDDLDDDESYETTEQIINQLGIPQGAKDVLNKLNNLNDKAEKAQESRGAAKIGKIVTAGIIIKIIFDLFFRN